MAYYITAEVLDSLECTQSQLKWLFEQAVSQTLPKLFSGSIWFTSIKCSQSGTCNLQYCS